MKLLLDTHSFLWFISGHSELSHDARQLIENPANQRFMSLASIWEMAIKVSIGKLTLAQPFGILIPQQMEINGIELLEIKMEHLAKIVDLPLHHRDPFDRLIIAQAMIEDISIVGTDSTFDAYPITRLW